MKKIKPTVSNLTHLQSEILDSNQIFHEGNIRYLPRVFNSLYKCIEDFKVEIENLKTEIIDLQKKNQQLDKKINYHM